MAEFSKVENKHHIMPKIFVNGELTSLSDTSDESKHHTKFLLESTLYMAIEGDSDIVAIYNPCGRGYLYNKKGLVVQLTAIGDDEHFLSTMAFVALADQGKANILVVPNKGIEGMVRIIYANTNSVFSL